MRSSPKRSDDGHRWNENHHTEVTYSENSTMQQKHHSNSYDMRETARGAQNSVKDDTKYVIENQVRFKYEYQSVFLVRRSRFGHIGLPSPYSYWAI